ncbi:MAG: iron export ABC transporter permease subunit FetB [Thermoleophilia bacterium]
MQGDVDALGLLLSMALVAVAILVSGWQRLGLGVGIAWAAARAIGQLLLVGVALRYVIQPDRPIVLAWVWVAAMVLFAAETLHRRAPEVPGARMLGVASFGASGVVVLGSLFGLGVFPLEARTLVPIAGMTVGNSMTATVVVGRRIVEELRDRRDLIEARLALGHSARDAARSHVRTALRTALSPAIESTKAVGLVFLPGAMTGLILAGVDPVDAVLVQAVVMYLVLGATATTTTVIALGLQRRLFTPDERLIRIPMPDR